ncbi:MAG: DinB family protein [Pyrinomonadaceae bacterium]
MKQDLITAFETDITKLIAEVGAFDSEEAFWSKGNGVPNSPGNLTLHLMGNLNHYIGAKLGASGYIRERPLEFSSGPLSLSLISQRLEQTREVVVRSINGLSDADIAADYPNDPGDDTRTVGAELVRILTHFNYHLGQINYHRRMTSDR